MPDDIIELQEKINWKDKFFKQSLKVTNCISSLHSSTSREFEIWYYSIPYALKDGTLYSTWEKFNLNTSPKEYKKWLLLYNQFWNWAWDHRLLLTTLEYDPLAIEWNDLGSLLKRRDKVGLKEWAITGLN